MHAQVVHLFDDMGIPASYRNMNGSSINTFTFINAAGNMTLVRFHWGPLAGAHAYTAAMQGCNGRTHCRPVEECNETSA